MASVIRLIRPLTYLDYLVAFTDDVINTTITDKNGDFNISGSSDEVDDTNKTIPNCPIVIEMGK